MTNNFGTWENGRLIDGGCLIGGHLIEVLLYNGIGVLR